MNKQFKAVIFDMDGVIVDSEPRHQQAFQEIFEEMGMSETHGITFSNYLGKSDRAVWLDFMEMHRPAQSIEELTEWKQSRLMDLIRREKPLFEGLPDLVSVLSLKYKLAVASGSLHPVIDVVLEIDGLRRFFQSIVSVQDVEHGKPAPDVYLKAARELNVDPANCCVIEDAPAGIKAAKAAGMYAVGITNSVKSDALNEADLVVHSYQEIRDLLIASE